jgi:hypothetical protein
MFAQNGYRLFKYSISISATTAETRGACEAPFARLRSINVNPIEAPKHYGPTWVRRHPLTDYSGMHSRQLSLHQGGGYQNLLVLF